MVLVGEMRDYETIAAALTVAETGHLVLARFTQTLQRSLSINCRCFPQEQQSQIRLQLSNVMKLYFSKINFYYN
jgi:twitching motility protein PilT